MPVHLIFATKLCEPVGSFARRGRGWDEKVAATKEFAREFPSEPESWNTVDFLVAENTPVALEEFVIPEEEWETITELVAAFHGRPIPLYRLPEDERLPTESEDEKPNFYLRGADGGDGFGHRPGKLEYRVDSLLHTMVFPDGVRYLFFHVGGGDVIGAFKVTDFEDFKFILDWVTKRWVNHDILYRLGCGARSNHPQFSHIFDRVLKKCIQLFTTFLSDTL